MSYRAFYVCYSTKEIVEDKDAHEIEPDEALAKAGEVLRGERDFFGLIDDQETTLQFMGTGKKVRMEIPVPAKRGSYGKTVTLKEVVKVIKSLGPTINVKDFEGLKFEKW